MNVNKNVNENVNMQEVLDRLEKTCRSQTQGGKVASYIPELATVDPTLFSLSATTVGDYGKTFSAGDGDALFSMQSISKVVTLAFALERFGADRVFRKVGMEPCSEPFNSIMKLEIASNTPLNPFINSGAIVIASMIAEDLREGAADAVLGFASRMARPEKGLAVNGKIYRSEASTADRNRALAYFMHSTGALAYGVEETLDLYFRMCSIEVTTADLSAIGATIANGGVSPGGARVMALETVYILMGLMSTCGLYNQSGEFGVRVGLPAKSGVGGGILCVVPARMGIAVFSPPLDEKGTSIAGFRALIALSGQMKLRGL
jgi:glutaminase